MSIEVAFDKLSQADYDTRFQTALAMLKSEQQQHLLSYLFKKLNILRSIAK